MAVAELRAEIQSRRQDGFLGSACATSKQGALIKSATNSIVIFIESSFHAIIRLICYFNPGHAVQYLDRWMKPMQQMKSFAWILLKKVPTWSEVETVKDELSDVELFDAENASKLHTQFTFVKNYCTTDKISKWKEDKASVESRWVEIFRFLDAESYPFDQISLIVQYVLCSPGTTAVVECMFSAITKLWTIEKSRLEVSTLKEILTVKYNLNFSCLEFYNYIKTKPELLRKVASQDKYVSKNKNDERNNEDEVDRTAPTELHLEKTSDDEIDLFEIPDDD